VSARSAEGMVPGVTGAMISGFNEFWRKNGMTLNTIGDLSQLSHDAMRAALEAALASRPDGWVLVPSTLTAENGAKAALMGEFFECVEDRKGRNVEVAISWTSIKRIYAAAIAHFAAAQPEQGDG